MDNYYEEYDPFDKVTEILGIVKEYAPQAVISQGEGYDQSSGEEYKYICLTNQAEDKLLIDITSEITIFFGKWHAHYGDIIGEYEEFLSDLKGILRNEKFAVCTSFNGEWIGSYLFEARELDIKYLREEVGPNKKIFCSFWDSTKNVVFDAEL